LLKRSKPKTEILVTIQLNKNTIVRCQVPLEAIQFNKHWMRIIKNEIMPRTNELMAQFQYHPTTIQLAKNTTHEPSAPEDIVPSSASTPPPQPSTDKDENHEAPEENLKGTISINPQTGITDADLIRIRKHVDDNLHSEYATIKLTYSDGRTLKTIEIPTKNIQTITKNEFIYYYIVGSTIFGSRANKWNYFTEIELV
jgi:hypothetical protein